MKPQLKSYVYFAPVASGIFFRGVGAEFMLKGKGLYDFLSPILSQFDGSQTLDSIKEPMSANQKKVVDTLVSQLLQTNMLVDNCQHNTLQLSDEERKIFSIGLQYLTDKAPDQLANFSAWRELKIAVIGNGPAQATMVEALLEQGIKQVYVVPVNDDIEFITLPEEHLALYSDLNQSLNAVSSEVTLVRSWSELQELHIDNILFTLANLQEATIDNLLEKAYLSTSMVKGLVSNIGSDQLVIANDPVKLLHESHELAKSDLSVIGTSIIQQQLSAAVLAQTLFDNYFDITKTNSQVTVIEDSLTINEHLLLSGESSIEWQQEDLSNFVTATKVLVDEKFGILSESNGNKLSQMPLNVDKLNVPSATDQQEVVAWGHDLADAKRKVTKSAITHYLKNKLGEDCFVGFSETESMHMAFTSLTAQFLAESASITLVPLALDTIDKPQTKKLVNTAEIYGDNFQCFLITEPHRNMLALAGTLDGRSINIVCGFDKESTLNELLAQLILDIQLPDETQSNVYSRTLADCMVSEDTEAYSSLDDVEMSQEVHASFEWQQADNNPLAHLGVYAIYAHMNLDTQGVHYAA